MTATTTAGSAPLSRDEAEPQRGRPGGKFAAWEEPELFVTRPGRVPVSPMNVGLEVAGRVVAA